eukprot:7301691-Pyramimonas_sp.AAC.1
MQTSVAAPHSCRAPYPVCEISHCPAGPSDGHLGASPPPTLRMLMPGKKDDPAVSASPSPLG